MENLFLFDSFWKKRLNFFTQVKKKGACERLADHLDFSGGQLGFSI